MASLGRGNPVAAVNQLQTFQNQIRAQLVARNPELAELLLQDCQEILNVLTGGQINPGGQPHGRRVTLVQKSKSSMRMQYEGQPRTSYIIEASTNLVDWEMIGVMVSDQTGVGIYDDSSATKYESRYYRTVLP